MTVGAPYLLADLTPVAACAVQGEGGQGHIVHARLGQLHVDAGQVVNGDGTDLAWQVAAEHLDSSVYRCLHLT